MSQVKSHKTGTGFDSVQKTKEDPNPDFEDFKYIQYIPRNMEKNSINFERAIRELHRPKHEETILRLKPQSPTKHGGFESVFLKWSKEKKRNSATKEVKGGKDKDLDDLISQSDKKAFMSSIQPEKKAFGIEAEGYVFGPHLEKCKRVHIHSRTCSKAKDLDLAEVQSRAFRFMVL